MSKSYTNNNNEIVKVSEEHLDASIEIYEELSNLSPSRRVSWARHKKLMEAEGFFDSENSERYRQMLKFERSRRGVLPSAQKLANLVAGNTITAIKNEIGNMKSAQLESNDIFQKLNKLKRELNRGVVLVESISAAVGEIDWNGIEKGSTFIYDDKREVRELLVTLNDIHYGYENDKFYTVDDAKKLVERYTDRVIKLAKSENVETIYVAMLGDEIEGVLRSASLVDTGMTPAQQTIEVSELIFGMLVRLSEFFAVKYVAIAGNHSRISPNFKEALDGDTYTVVHRYIMKVLLQGSKRIEFIEPLDEYYHLLNINGYNLYLCHGDRDNVRGDGLLADLSSKFNTLIDIVVGGHFHTHSVREVSGDKYIVITGSIKGPDGYSDKINKNSCRSQVGIVFSKNDFEIRQIKL